MKTGISKREKKLLFGAGLVLVLYLSIQFAILPLSSAYNTGLEDRDRLRSEQEAHDLEAAQLPNLRIRSAETRERFYALTNEYTTVVPNEHTDQRLTALCRDNNLRVISLRFAPRPAAPPPPPPEYDADGNIIEVEVEHKYPVFITVTAFMSLTGSYDSLMNLIDEVVGIKYIRISNASLTRNYQDGMDTSTISITFEVTYLADN
jgi:hypothetical protein